jgi:hypothetical protein
MAEDDSKFDSKLLAEIEEAKSAFKKGKAGEKVFYVIIFKIFIVKKQISKHLSKKYAKYGEKTQLLKK